MVKMDPLAYATPRWLLPAVACRENQKLQQSTSKCKLKIFGKCLCTMKVEVDVTLDGIRGLSSLELQELHVRCAAAALDAGGEVTGVVKDKEAKASITATVKVKTGKLHGTMSGHVGGSFCGIGGKPAVTASGSVCLRCRWGRPPSRWSPWRSTPWRRSRRTYTAWRTRGGRTSQR